MIDLRRWMNRALAPFALSVLSSACVVGCVNPPSATRPPVETNCDERPPADINVDTSASSTESAATSKTPVAPTPSEIGSTDVPSAEAPSAKTPNAETPSIEAPSANAWIEVTPQIRVDRTRGVIECRVVSVLEVGFLEQYVCSVGTREHESLFAFEGKASELHAALLLVGCRPGQPGSWREAPPVEQPTNPPTENHRFVAVPPTGEPLELSIELPDGSRQPLTYFVRASPVGQPTNSTNQTELIPPRRFVFAGSRFRTDQRTGAERYIADGSGSIVGLVTFGDETIAAEDVIPDQVSAAEPVWEAFSERMPKPGTRLTLRIERARRTTQPRRSPRSSRLLRTSRSPRSSRLLRTSATRCGAKAWRNKKARPRQSLRPSPSGGRMLGRYLPTSLTVTPASDQSKAFLANSLWKVNSLQPVGSAKCSQNLASPLGPITQVPKHSGFVTRFNRPSGRGGEATPKDGFRCIS